MKRVKWFERGAGTPDGEDEDYQPGLADTLETAVELMRRSGAVWLTVWAFYLLLEVSSDLAVRSVDPTGSSSPMVLGFVLGLLIVSRTYLYAFAAPMHDTMFGEVAPDFSTSIVEAFRVWPAVALTSLVVGAAVVLGLFALLIPGLAALFFLARAPYEAARGASVSDSLRSSARLARAHPRAAATTFALILVGVYGVLGLDHLYDWVVTLAGLDDANIAVVLPGLLLGSAWSFAVWVAVAASYIVVDARRSGALASVNGARPPASEAKAGWRSKPVSLGLEIVVFIALFWGISSYQTREHVTAGEPAAFELVNLEGESRSAADYEGRPSLVYFWAPWCGVCSKQSANIAELAAASGDANVISVAVSYEDPAQVRDYTAKHGVDYEVLLGDEATRERFRVRSFPTVYFLRPDGRVDRSVTGYTTSFGLRWRLFLASL